MSELSLKKLAPDQAQTLTNLVAQPPFNVLNFKVQAASHLLTYTQSSEVQPGVPAFRVEVSGPHADKIGRYLENRTLLYRGEPFNPELNWYVFEEFEPQAVTFHVVDLASGSVAIFQHAEIVFSGWHAGSSELIYQDIARLKVESWFAYDVANGQSRCLFVGGQQAFLATKGQALLIVAAREVFVALIEINTGRVIDRLLKIDFASLVENPARLQLLHYDAEISSLYALVEQAGTTDGAAVAIEVKP